MSTKHCEVNDVCGSCQKLIEGAGGMGSLFSLSSASSLSSCPVPLSEMDGCAGSKSKWCCVVTVRVQTSYPVSILHVRKHKWRRWRSLLQVVGDLFQVISGNIFLMGFKFSHC